ncbi:MAG: hypothetical protein ACT4OP_11280 [Actinomycetota bacterium]
MAKEKATITVDRAKLEEARHLLGAASASAAIDAALAMVIRRERVRHDVEAYMRLPQTEDEAALGRMPRDWADLADDVDWDSEWPEGS